MRKWLLLRQITGQIIQLVVDQTNLSREEVLERIRQLERSFNYHVDGLDDEPDPTFPKLLAQELRVDLGDPAGYLYPELIYDEAPLFVRVIPLITVDKERIKTTLRNLTLELEPQIRTFCKLTKNHPIGLSEELRYLTRAQGQLFVKDGIVIQFEAYDDYNPVFKEDFERDYVEDFKLEFLQNATLEDIIDRTELYRTFTDYKIIRTDDPNKTYIPYSLLDKVKEHPPDWASFDEENFRGYLQFPYITLESLQVTPELENLSFYNPFVKEIVGTEALQYCHNLKEIIIIDEIETLEKLTFPPHLSLANLELLEIGGTSLKKEEFDLSFLQNSPKLRQIQFNTDDAFIWKLVLPPFDNHALLEEIYIAIRRLKSIELSSPWYCPNLRKVTLFSDQLETIDLTPFKYCSGLQEFLCSNRLKNLDLSPLKHCTDLRELDVGGNRVETLDLSPLRHCNNL